MRYFALRLNGLTPRGELPAQEAVPNPAAPRSMLAHVGLLVEMWEVFDEQGLRARVEARKG